MNLIAQSLGKMNLSIRYYSICVVGVLLAVAVISGCRKSQRDDDVDTQSSADAARAISYANAIFNQVHGVVIEDSLALYKIGAYDGCIDSVVTTTTLGTFPKTTIIYYGGTTCPDSRIWQGEVIVKQTGLFNNDSLSVATITFRKFSIGDSKVEGSMSITNNGTNGSGNRYYSTTTDMELDSVSRVIEWNETFTREWVSGDATSTKSDDSYTLSGSATGRHSRGNSFSITVTDVLDVSQGCSTVSSGTMDVKPNNLSQRVSVFGSCDTEITVAIHNRSYAVPFE